MKRRAFLAFLGVPLAAATTLTETQVRAAAKARWGDNARIRETWKPKGTSWIHESIEIGVQEYQPATIPGSDFLNGVQQLNPNAGQPKIGGMTVKGVGTTWTSAWTSVK